MLLPATMLVVLLLGAIAFDLSLVFLRQRQASAVAAGLANDLAAVAFDEAVFRSTGRFELDARRAEAVGLALLDASDVAGEIVSANIALPDPRTVAVVIAVQVDYVFARSIPGAADGTVVTARATASARP